MSNQPDSPQPQAYAGGCAGTGYQPKFPQNQPQPPQPAPEAVQEEEERRRPRREKRRHHSIWGYILMFIGLMTVLFLVFKYIVVPIMILLAGGMDGSAVTGGTMG